MIANKIRPDAPNIGREINKDSGERPKLDDRDRGGRLLSVARVEVCPTAREYQMCCRTDRNEFGQALHYPEDDCL